jgi:hypothetical protein
MAGYPGMPVGWLNSTAVLLGQYQLPFARLAQRIKFACVLDHDFAPAIEEFNAADLSPRRRFARRHHC